MSIALIIVGLLLFIGLVLVHEFGHFIAARRNGIDVEEFGLGFPPRAKVITKKKGTTYTLNWLPLGGFVRLKGEHDADRQKGGFGAASLSAKVKVMTAGVGMNLLTAFVLFTILALVGIPKIIEHQFTINSDTKVSQQEVFVGAVEPDSPAQKAGLNTRSQIVSIGLPGQAAVAITGQDQLPKVTKQFAGQTVQVTVRTNNQTETKQVTLREAKDADKGYLGIVPTEYVLQRSTWSAPIVAGGIMGQIVGSTFTGLWSAVNGLLHANVSQATSQVSGPVGIVVIIKDNSFLGFQFILLMVAVISLSLAIMNILPIPALDGGRLFLILFYRLIRRPLTVEREDVINGVGFLALLVLIGLITFVDIKRNF